MDDIDDSVFSGPDAAGQSASAAVNRLLQNNAWVPPPVGQERQRRGTRQQEDKAEGKEEKGEKKRERTKKGKDANEEKMKKGKEGGKADWVQQSFSIFIARRYRFNELSKKAGPVQTLTS
jgi:hypothetical protein